MLAVLLMIAVAVAAALITYAWVMTYLESTTSRAGHAIQIQSVAFSADGSTATVYAQNVGDGTIVLKTAYLDGALATATFAPSTLGEGLTSEIEVEGVYVSGGEYKFKIVGDDGTFTSGTYTRP